MLMTRRLLGPFIGMSGWLPFEQHLREILQCDDISASARVSNQEVHSDGNSQIRREDTAGQDSSSGEESEADADAFSEPDSDDHPFKQSGSSHDEFDPFGNDEEEAPVLVQAVNHSREILDLPIVSKGQQSPEDTPPPVSFHHLQTPVFLGHGCEDPKVSVDLGRKMSHVLSTGFGIDVTWNAYEGLGHWYRVDDEIEDILCFLQDRVRIPVKPVSTSRS